MLNTVLEHVPIKLETFDDDQFDCDVWKASATTAPTAVGVEADKTRTTTTVPSSASSTSSRTTNLENEIENCANVFILNRRKLFLICGFCDSKYANMLQLAKHFHDCHDVFATNDDDSNRGGGAASETESDSDASTLTANTTTTATTSAPRLLLQGGFHIRFVREGSPVSETVSTLRPSIDDTLLKHVPIKLEKETNDDVTMVDDTSNSMPLSAFEENIESCGNIFVMNRSKLFFICGFCERSKYANMELFAAHLHECHTIFQEDDEPNNVPAGVTIKTEPEEVLLSLKDPNTNNENAPPMVALPTGINVNNQDIIPQEEIKTPNKVPAPAAVTKKSCNANKEGDMNPQKEVETLAATASVDEDNILKETRNKKRKSATTKEYFSKEGSAFPCKECSKIFVKQSRLVEHMRLHTGEKPFKCQECGKSFRIKLRMTEHQLRHRSEKAFICEVCGLGLATRQDYSLHQRHHNGDKRYACEECGKAFVRSSDLKTHIRIHSDERPFKCEVCNLSFRANQNLIIHRRVHQGDKQFKCDYCDKRFLRKIDKRVHHRTHTGEKAFKCEICGRGYSAKVHVRRHIQKRHIDPMETRDSSVTSGMGKRKAKSNKKFACDSCSKTYSTKITLRKHIERLHKGQHADEQITKNQSSSDQGLNIVLPKPGLVAAAN